MGNKRPTCLDLSLGIEAVVKDLAVSKDVLNRPGKRVVIFGGMQIPDVSPYYVDATTLANNLSSAGISIITGGGPGIMEAANKGAKSSNSGASSYGLKVGAIKIEHMQKSPYVDKGLDFNFSTLSVRLLTLISSSDAIVFFPGGYGTLEELFCLLVRIRIGMLGKIPIYLIGSKYWSGLVSWLSNFVLPEKVINSQDLELFKIEDDIEKVSQGIVSHCLALNY